MGFKYDVYEERLRLADFDMAKVNLEAMQKIIKALYPPQDWVRVYDDYLRKTKENPQPEVNPDWGPVSP